MTSALLISFEETIKAPEALKDSSLEPAKTPAPFSINTSKPTRVNFETRSGTMATLRSPARLSFGINTFIGAKYHRELSGKELIGWLFFGEMLVAKQLTVHHQLLQRLLPHHDALEDNA